MAEHVRVILLGAPGSGKGTQAVTLSQHQQVAHVSSGDLFREEQARDTELGRLAKEYMKCGDLVPNEVTIKMILGRVERPDCEKGYILDGFPRNTDQAEALDEALEKAGAASIDRVVYINVSNEELMRRLGGRWVCRARQHPYHVQSAPPKVAGVCDTDGSELYQRPDDSEETARKRLEVYLEQTVPLIDCYRKSGRLSEIDGEQEIDKVGKSLASALQ